MSALERLLQETSRTFALSIPLLPAGLRREVATAYLLFRIADTLEDEALWPVPQRAQALERLAALLDREPGESGESGATAPAETLALVAAAPVGHAGYAELLASTGSVLGELRALPPGAQAAIVRHLRRTIAGMIEFLGRPDGLTGVADVRAYCYAVAGIVGELCTELFIESTPSLRAAQRPLLELGVAFGEGLQLVNILKDEQHDRRNGRRYVPAGAERSGLLELALSDLQQATRYLELLERHGADPGVVAFNALNLVLAFASLARIREHGAGAKLSREEVAQALAGIHRALEKGSDLFSELFAGRR